MCDKQEVDIEASDLRISDIQRMMTEKQRLEKELITQKQENKKLIAVTQQLKNQNHELNQWNTTLQDDIIHYQKHVKKYTNQSSIPWPSEPTKDDALFKYKFFLYKNMTEKSHQIGYDLQKTLSYIEKYKTEPSKFEPIFITYCEQNNLAYSEYLAIQEIQEKEQKNDDEYASKQQQNDDHNHNIKRKIGCSPYSSQETKFRKENMNINKNRNSRKFKKTPSKRSRSRMIFESKLCEYKSFGLLNKNLTTDQKKFKKIQRAKERLGDHVIKTEKTNVHCICGNKFELIQSRDLSQALNDDPTDDMILCKGEKPDCQVVISNNQLVAHCPDVCNVIHPEGYDLCEICYAKLL